MKFLHLVAGFAMLSTVTAAQSQSPGEGHVAVVSRDALGASDASAGGRDLTMAAHTGHGSLGGFLLAHNADPNAVLTNGTPVRKHSQDLAFNIDWRGATAMGDQATTVMAAMRIGTGNRLSLSRRGLNLTNREAELVDETAETARSVDAVERVLDLGADVDQPNARGETPLHVAVTQESLPLIRLLVDRRANINARNNEGKTPLGVALARAAAAAEARPNVLRLTEAKDPNVNPVADLLRSLGATE